MAIDKDRLLALIDKLEEDLVKCEVQYLKQRLTAVDKDVERMEKKLHTTPDRNLAELFVKKILDQYADLIHSQCFDMANKINQPYMDKDDFMQESFEYMLRWCLPKVKQFSTADNLWIPFLKRSLNNCFVNLSKKHTTQLRKADVINLSDIIADMIPDPDQDVEDHYESKQLVKIVLSKLSKRDGQIFSDIISPTVGLRTFITLKRSLYKSVRLSSRKLLAEYYDLPVSTVNGIFTRFRKTITKVCLEI